MKRLGINSILLTLSSLVSQAISLGTFWLLARALAPAELGPLMAALGIAGILTSTIDFGVNTVTIRSLAKDPRNSSIFISTLSTKLALTTMIGLLWILLSTFLALYDSYFLFILPFGAYIALSDAESSILVVARSRERMEYVAFISFIEKAVCLSVVAFTLRFFHQERMLALSIAMVTGAAVGSGVALSMLEPAFRRIRPVGIGSIVNLWRSSTSFGIVGLSTQLQRLHIVIVAAAAGPAMSGIFVAASRLVSPFALLPDSLASALFARVSGATDLGTSRSEARRAISIMLVINVFGIGLVFWWPTPVIDLLLGPSYSDSGNVVRALLVATLVASANSPLSALAQAGGQERQVGHIISLASLVGLSTVAAGSFLAGAFGAALGFCGLQLSILLGLAYLDLNRWRVSGRPAWGMKR